jgi:hypothetical protein
LNLFQQSFAKEIRLKAPRRTVIFRFYEELNDYLPKSQRKRDIEIDLPKPKPLASVVKALGVPLAEVDLLLVNGASVHFDAVLKSGDRVSVFPVFERLNIEKVTQVRARPLRRPRFVAEADLYDLSALLRRAGMDVICLPHGSDQEILNLSLNERRIILTRRKALVHLPGVTHAVHVHSDSAADQLQEILNKLDLD